jgi:hypothetical protein
VNGYETIGITPELLALMNGEWSPPVRVRASRGANGALELEFQTAAEGDPVEARGYKTQRPERRATPPAVPPVSSGKGAPSATDH